MNSLRKAWRAARAWVQSRAKTLADFAYYLDQGHTPKSAWNMARNTL